jgi:hypothetical protein
MNHSVRNLVLAPSLLLSSFTGSFLYSFGFLSPISSLVYVVSLSELIIAWDRDIKNQTVSDFRFFYASQSRLVIAYLLLLSAWIFSSLLWRNFAFLTLFLYLASFVYRSVTFVGLNFVEQKSNLVPISEVRSQIATWDDNKSLCRLLVEQNKHLPVAHLISQRINYSSYLRSEEASTLLLSLTSDANPLNLEHLLNELNRKMS